MKEEEQSSPVDDNEEVFGRLPSAQNAEDRMRLRRYKSYLKNINYFEFTIWEYILIC
jgi:hypothetical protein